MISFGLTMLCLIAPWQGAVPELPILAIRASRLIDVRNGAVVTNPVVLIQGDRIKEVGANLSVPPKAQVIDLSGATLLPGLIDCHTHLLHNNQRSLSDEDSLILESARLSTAKRALLGAKLAGEVLRAGFTTVRDVGNSGTGGDLALRDAIDLGWVQGPRIVACSRAIAPVGGQFGSLEPIGWSLIGEEYRQASGVDECRKAVRQAIFEGADCIKVIVDAGSIALSQDEVKAIVEEAHRANRRVAAHAANLSAILIAARSGVDSIEHGFELNGEAAKIMATNKVFLVPNDYLSNVYVMGVPGTPTQIARLEGLYQGFCVNSRRRLKVAVEAGVRIAAGSDMYYALPGLTRGQASAQIFKAYAEAGMTPLAILRAATVDAADLLGWHDRVGSIETGKLADIIAVRGDPMKDISELERVGFVMKDGLVVRNEMGRPRLRSNVRIVR